MTRAEIHRRAPDAAAVADLVKQLRDHPAENPRLWSAIIYDCCQAAAALEALAARCAELQKELEDGATEDAEAADRFRLRAEAAEARCAELEAVLIMTGESAKKAAERITGLEAERDRLRAALQIAIDTMTGVDVYVCSRQRINYPTGEEWWYSQQDKVRAALSGAPPKGAAE